MYKIKQIKKNSLIEKLDNTKPEIPVENCLFSTITSDNDDERRVDLTTATPYTYPNDVSNKCICTTAYENIGEYWYCRANY